MFRILITLALFSAACNPYGGSSADVADTDTDVRPDPGQAIYYTDADGDGRGNAATATIYDEGSNPVGTVLLGDDCDDANGSIWYGCGGDTDVDYVTACLDGDGDGYASSVCLSFPEDAIPSGWLPVAVTDCDDSDRSRTTDCDDPVVEVDDNVIGNNEARVQVGTPSVILVGDNLATQLRNDQVATADNGFFIVPADITPGRMNPDQDLGLYGYGLGGAFDWQFSLVDLIPAVDRNGTLVGFGQALPEGLYRVNCGAPLADLIDDVTNAWCNLELLNSPSWTVDFMECGMPKQSLCLRVEGDGDVVTSEADCIGLYVAPDECEDGDGAVVPDPDYRTWYRDGDGDGYGTAQTQSAVNQPAGYVSRSGDCDDARTAINPGATEIPNNGLDDNCNLLVDEGGGAQVVCYLDSDGDGYGALTGGQQYTSCPAGRVANNTDCDDVRPGVHPGASEIAGNGIDEDCVNGDGAQGGGQQGNGTCTVRVTLDGDSSVDGDSSYHMELYAQPFDGNAAQGGAYWPTDLDWSNNGPADFTELVSVSNGSQSTGTMNNVAESFDYVVFNGGVWQTSNGGGFIRWVFGNNYADSSAGVVSAEYSCNGGSYQTMSCGQNGNDWRCNR